MHVDQADHSISGVVCPFPPASLLFALIDIAGVPSDYVGLIQFVGTSPHRIPAVTSTHVEQHPIQRHVVLSYPNGK